MPEFDSIAGEHEVIESAEALFRHLYEAHGVEEAGDLDPDLTAVEPWLRRHAELERASRRIRREQRDDAAEAPAEPPAEPPGPRAGARTDAGRDRSDRSDHAGPQAGGVDRPGGVRAPRVFDQQRLRAGDAGSSPSGRARPGQAPSSPPPPGQAADSRQGSGFRDPLVRALAAELFRRGHDERAVRRYIHRYVALTPEGGLTGEAGIRASFIDPILEVIAEQLDPSARRERAAPRRTPATGAGAGDGRSAEEVQEDLMAIANIFRRRQRARSAI